MGHLRGAAGWVTVLLALGLSAGVRAECDPRALEVSSAPSIPPHLTLSQVQGAAPTSRWAGQWVRSAGVVTLVVPGGVYLQDPTGDGDPQTSDAVFVTLKAGHTWRAGQWWQLLARVEEWPVAGAHGPGPRPSRTVLAQARDHQLLGVGCAVQAQSLPLPTMPVGQPHDALESMLLEVAGPLTVGQVHQQSGAWRLWVSAGPRDRVATDQAPPGPAAQAINTEAVAHRLAVSIDPQTALVAAAQAAPNAAPLWRGGQVLSLLRGVQDSRLTNTGAPVAALRLLATQVVIAVHSPARPAPPPPPPAGQVRVAGVNLHNFFTSLGKAQTDAQANADADADADADELTGCRQGHQHAWRWCRGADDLASYRRQRDKLVDLIAGLKADVVGVMELENNRGRALQALVEALNAQAGEAHWAAVAPSAEGGGQDAVTVGLLYRPGRLQPIGRARNDTDPVHHRSPLAQAFRTVQGGELLVVVNHFKSRQCLRAKGADQDQRDGQGCFNDRRSRQAWALHRFVESLQQQGAPQAALLLGDFNAHTYEAPLLQLRNHGWQDLLAQHAPTGWSYVWAGQAGRLDHLLASPALALSAKAAGEWHANADEPPPSAREPGPWRASDHDPVWVDFSLP